MRTTPQSVCGLRTTGGGPSGRSLRTMHVLVLDPNPTVRCALEALFASEPHMSATVGEDLDALSGRGRFDVALVDERIAGAIGERERATLDGLLRAAPVVVMGMGEPESYARVHIAAGAAG